MLVPQNLFLSVLAALLSVDGSVKFSNCGIAGNESFLFNFVFLFLLNLPYQLYLYNLYKYKKY